MVASHAPVPRVLIIALHFWPEPFRINEVAALLAEQGTAVTVLTGQPNYPEGKVYRGYRAGGAGWSATPFGVDVVRVPIVPRGRAGPFRLACTYASFLVSSCLAGSFLLRGRKFDAILFYGVSPTVLALVGFWFRRLKKAPFALWVQDLWPGSLDAVGYRYGPRADRVLTSIVGYIYRHCDAILVASRGFASDVRRVARRDIDCIYHPNPAEISVMEAQSAPTPKPGSFKPFEVLFAGNLGRAVGLETILETAGALACDATVRFRIVGGGSRRNWLVEEIARRGLTNIVVDDRVDPALMPQVLETASALVITLVRSPAMELSLPSKTATFLASGKPLLVSADGEVSRVVGEAGAGLCAPAQDPVGLADAIKRLQALPEEKRRAMGAAGRAYCERNFEPRDLAGRLSRHLQVAVERYQQSKHRKVRG